MTDICFDQIRLKRNPHPLQMGAVGFTLREAVHNSLQAAPLGEYSLFTEHGREIQIILLDRGENTRALWSQYKGYDNFCSLIIQSGEIEMVIDHGVRHARSEIIEPGQTIAFQDTDIYRRDAS